MRTTYLDVLQNKPVQCAPIWIMRQAGRYLPEYRRIRAKFADFMAMCKNAEACAEVALQPINRYDLDAAIVFSDILTVPEAMGMSLKFVAGKGPVFADPIRSEKALEKLDTKNALERLAYVTEAVSATKSALQSRIPLIGFCGSPWTLAAYMIEGQGSKQFLELRKMLYAAPFQLHRLLKKITQVSAGYLLSQIRAGADAVMIFDTWGGLLASQNFPLFSLAYMEDLARFVKSHYPSVPVTLFTKGGGLWLEKIARSGCDAVGVDWCISLEQACQKVNGKIALQGNLDPAELYGANTEIRQAVKNIFLAKDARARYVFNLGHGIYPDIDPEKVSVMVDAVREFGT